VCPVQRAGARSKRLFAGMIVLLALFGCASGSDSEDRLAQDCAKQGLAPGTQASAACVERQQLQQQMELEQIRQAREAARGGTRL
jgi:hypothetical protein